MKSSTICCPAGVFSRKSVCIFRKAWGTALLLLLIPFATLAQVVEPFKPRTSAATPARTVYNIKGDFVLIGNTNLTLQTYGDNLGNGNRQMAFVDVDGDPNTVNSSSATLAFSDEGGQADPACSNIVYAGLYWTGRAHNDGSSPMTFEVGGKTVDKRQVKLKKAGGAYQTITAGPSDIYYPSGAHGNMYSAYAEVTDIVRANGTGEYFVADLAVQAERGDPTGFYGGWGMVVVYENPSMERRAITVFDGHAYVASAAGTFELGVAGFNTPPTGAVGVKMGMMAGEGDVEITGDTFALRGWQPNTSIPQDHFLPNEQGVTNNFFNAEISSSITRNPNLKNNTGLDIKFIELDNSDKKYIRNNQTSTSFLYNSTQDTYIIFSIVFAVDDYVLEVEANSILTAVNGVPVADQHNPPMVRPGDRLSYCLEVKNSGNESVSNAVVAIPMPHAGIFLSESGTAHPSVAPPSPPAYDAAAGTLVWDLGILPVPGNPNTVLAKLCYDIEVTADCYLLTSQRCAPSLLVDGRISGTGTVTGLDVGRAGDFIFGFADGKGTCAGLPITEPTPVPIDIGAAGCTGGEAKHVLFCAADVVNEEIPLSRIAGDFPDGTRFYSAISGSGQGAGTEYSVAVPFPGVTGSQVVYYAVPPGRSAGCYLTFSIQVDAACGVATEKTVADADANGRADAGEELTYTIRVANNFTKPVTVDIADLVPANTVYLSHSAGGSYDSGTGIITWNNLLVPANRDLTVTFVVKVVDDLTGIPEIKNTATVTGPDLPLPQTPKADIDTNPILGLELTKTADRTKRYGILGEKIEYTIRVKNVGNVALTDIVVTDANADDPDVGTVLLPPGQAHFFTAYHTVEQTDIDDGYVYNIALATGKYATNGGSVTAESEDSDPCSICPVDPACPTCTVVPLLGRPIIAVDDAYEHPWSGSDIVMGSVLDNDTFDGQPIVPAKVTLTPLTPSDPGLRMVSDGTVIVSGTLRPGRYEYPYRICEMAVPDNCSDATAVIVIQLDDLFIPGAFTPNGDGDNDLFEILGEEEYDRIELTVINRWGNEVYRSNDYRNSWGGYNLNNGTYYYIIKAWKGEEMDLRKGFLLLSR